MKNKLICYIVFCVLGGTMLFAQNSQSGSGNTGFENVYSSADLNTHMFSSHRQRQIDRGDQALASKSYTQALYNYNQALSNTKDLGSRTEILYKIGLCYYKLRRITAAYPSLKSCWDAGQRDDDFLRLYAQVLSQLNDYNNASQVLNLVQTKDSLDIQRINSWPLLQAKMNTNLGMTAKNLRLQTKISSPYADYALSMMDGNLVFVSSRYKQKGLMNTQTGEWSPSLYTAPFSNALGMWDTVSSYDLKLPLNIGVGDVSYDAVNRIVYCILIGSQYTGLHTYTRNPDGSLIGPKVFQFNGFDNSILDSTNISQASISPDGEILLFSSKGSGNFGSSDIWMIKRAPKIPEIKGKKKKPHPRPSRKKKSGPEYITNNEEWLMPVKLGSKVNTGGTESFPVWINNTSFSFSSDGKPGSYGGADIYIAFLDSARNELENVEHLLPPVNSSFDDYSFLNSQSLAKSFFASSRPSITTSKSDIYGFDASPSLIDVKGCVLNQQSKDSISDYIVLLERQDGYLFDTLRPQHSKSFHFQAKYHPNFNFYVKRRNYSSDTFRLELPSLYAQIPMEHNISETYYLSPEKDTIPILPLASLGDSTQKRDSLLLAFDAANRPKLDSSIISPTQYPSPQKPEPAVQSPAQPVQPEPEQTPVSNTNVYKQYNSSPVYNTTKVVPVPIVVNNSSKQVPVQSQEDGEDVPMMVLGSGTSPAPAAPVPSPAVLAPPVETASTDQAVPMMVLAAPKDEVPDPAFATNSMGSAHLRTYDIDPSKGKIRVNQGNAILIRSKDDRALVSIKDPNNHKFYINLPPNSSHRMDVNPENTGSGPNIPQIQRGEGLHRVQTENYVILDCAPKLSELDDEVYVNDVYFAFNQAKLINDDHRELDRMIKISRENTNLQFELGAYADQRGSQAYNKNLTQKRAKSVIDYVARNGMDISRLHATAYGKEHPIVAQANTEYENSLNRRVEIKLIDPNAKDVLEGRAGYSAHKFEPFDLKGFKFMVQVGAFTKPIDNPQEYFKDVIQAYPNYKITYFMDKDGLYKYNVGNDYSNIETAREIVKTLCLRNRPCYVSAYMDGKRITVNEALVAIKRQNEIRGGKK